MKPIDNVVTPPPSQRQEPAGAQEANNRGQTQLLSDRVAKHEIQIGVIGDAAISPPRVIFNQSRTLFDTIAQPSYAQT
jgi:hypothetical protein